jgi:hypothetical protein
MPGLRRAAPSRLVLELTQQLAEEYASIPLPTVNRVVADAVATTTGPEGRLEAKAEGIPAVMVVIEHLAREDLDHLQAGGADVTAQTSGVMPGPTAPAPPEPDPNRPRRGAA